MRNKDHFPLLREFARGYLHQDMVPEYGDANGAAKAYISDLGKTERKGLAAEARKMATAAKNWTNDEVNQQLHGMGAACTLASRDELIELLRILETAR